MLPTPDSPIPPDPETTDDAPLPAPNFDTPARPIAELVGDPDFPASALGLHVDIAGITGVITEIVRHSVKLRTPEGQLKSYNAYSLCKLHGPAPRVEEAPPPSAPAPVTFAAAAATEDEEAEPERHVITEPDFTLPVQPIAGWVHRADFPQCAFGVHVDLGGYSGVVVEIVQQSLKVFSPEGDLRSYNAAVLRKLHGGR